MGKEILGRIWIDTVTPPSESVKTPPYVLTPTIPRQRSSLDPPIIVDASPSWAPWPRPSGLVTASLRSIGRASWVGGSSDAGVNVGSPRDQQGVPTFPSRRQVNVGNRRNPRVPPTFTPPP